MRSNRLFESENWRKILILLESEKEPEKDIPAFDLSVIETLIKAG